MTIGERIRAAREEKKMTQEELGTICGTTKQSIFKYETGVITNIPRDKMEKIASALGVTPTYLMGWDTKPLTVNQVLSRPTTSPSESEKNKPAESELDELDKELLRLAAQLTPEQKRRQVETLRDIVGKKDT
ncbi:MAG: helix-turn-helix domain-containing protein [Oscillospiraceae bacterium]|nr:helix-turn-helix domain-containing protein [Oscillospiraceae bacterium]